MAEPLPDGFVDTGATGDFTVTATLQLTHLEDGTLPELSVTIPNGAANMIFSLRQTDMIAGPCPLPGGGTGHTIQYNVKLNPNDVDHTVESYATPPLTCEALTDQHDSAAYDLEVTAGPFRLGMRYTYVGDPDAHPKWAKDYQVEFAWFADENTVVDATFGGFAMPTVYWIDGGLTPPSPAAQQMGQDFGEGTFGDQTNTGAQVYGVFGNVAVNGQSQDYSGQTDGNLVGTGAGSAEVQGGGGGEFSFRAPFHVQETVGGVDTAGGDLGATVVDADGNTHTTPVTQTRIWFRFVSPEYALERSWSVQSAWAAAQDPPYASDDRTIMFQLAPPRQFGAGTTFTPVSIDITSPLSVHRPDAGRPSDWVTSDAGLLTVAESATETTITVTNTGGSVSRTLLTDFPHRIGVFGTGDPLFGYGEKENQTHEAGEDIFSWGSYAYQDWLIEGPDGDLTLTVEGSWYTVEDDYLTTGRTYDVTEEQYTATYVVTADAGGVTVSRVDLNFPVSGDVPFYHGQIRKLTLSGFAVGTYTIKQIDLVADRAYFKAGWGKQVSRYDYSMVHAAVNGASPFLNWGDQHTKPPEVGSMGVGGPIRLAVISESPTLGTQDVQFSLEELFNLWPGAEGMTRTWDSAAFTAACEDAEGNSLGTGLAQWVLPVFGDTWTPGTPYEPACSVVCGSVLLCAGQAFELTAKLTLGGDLEALAATTGGNRAGAGHVIGAYRDDTGAQVATGTTDSDGYVITEPVRTINGSLAHYLAPV